MAVSLFKIRGRVFYGWWVLLACAAILFYVGGTFFQGFTALFNPIADEFGWSYALISLAFTFRGFEAGILAPVIGFFVDRFGPGRLLFTGTIIMGVAFLLFSQIQALWSFYAVFLILALGFSLCSGTVTITAVAIWFKKRRSLAMGMLASGFGAGGLLVPAVVWLSDDLGWRWAVAIFGAGAWLLCLPLSLLVRSPPKENEPFVQTEAATAVDERQTYVGVKEILNKKSFWLFSLAIFFSGVAGMAIMVHQIPYMVSIGISRQTAGFLVIILSLANVAGRLVFGYLGDHMEKRYCFAIAILIKALGVLAFALSTTVGQFIPSLIAMGLGFGGVIPLRPILQIELFGMTSFATVGGLLMTFITVGSIMSPPFAGLVFDLVGSYRPAFIALSLSTLVAIPLIMAAPRQNSHSPTTT